MSDQPNILLISTDQQFAGAMSCTGNTDLHTPHMDSLAASGTRYERAYCSYPLCTPARASMFFGRMPHQLGIQGNERPPPEMLKDTSLGQLVQNAGYHCAYGGKWHIDGLDIPDHHGYELLCAMDDWGLPGACDAYLKREHDKPFFLVASFDDPHNIWEWTQRIALPWGEVEMGPAAEWPRLPANHKAHDDEPEVLRHEKERNCQVYRAERYSESDWRAYRYAYYRLVERVDEWVGRILTSLKNSPYADNTVVIFTSDHGDGLGAHEWNQKNALWEESIRVPLIISDWREKNPTACVDDAAPVAAGLDLYATIADLAGATPHADTLGKSVHQDRREYLVVETQLSTPYIKVPASGRCIIDRSHKYAFYSIGENREQLFNLNEDPGETQNLIHTSPSELDRLRTQLREWLTLTQDRFDGHYCHPKAYSRLPREPYTPEDPRRQLS